MLKIPILMNTIFHNNNIQSRDSAASASPAQVYTLTENGAYTAVNAGIFLTQLDSISDYFAITYQGGY